MKITTVIENRSTRENLTAQYGLSLLVETEYGSILVDAGQDDAALNNLGALGRDLSKINAVFISHNHDDHVGGLGAVLEATADNPLPVFVSGSAKSLLYSKRLFRRRVLVSRNELIEGGGERVVLVNDVEEILPGAYACRIKSADGDFVCKDRKLRMLSEDGKLIPDDFRHEIYLAVIEDGAVKIVSPCSHNGIVNIIKDAEERFGLPVKSFVGGLHLRGNSSRSLSCPKSHVLRIADMLNESSLEKLYTCHCTGFKAFSILKEHLSEKILLKYFHTGYTFKV